MSTAIFLGNIISKAKELGFKILQFNAVVKSNEPALYLYEKLGFVIKQRLKAYYRDGEDAYLMAVEFAY